MFFMIPWTDSSEKAPAAKYRWAVKSVSHVFLKILIFSRFPEHFHYFFKKCLRQNIDELLNMLSIFLNNTFIYSQTVELFLVEKKTTPAVEYRWTFKFIFLWCCWNIKISFVFEHFDRSLRHNIYIYICFCVGWWCFINILVMFWWCFTGEVLGIF